MRDLYVCAHPEYRMRVRVIGAIVFPELGVVVHRELIPEMVVQHELRADGDGQTEIAGHDVHVFARESRLEDVIRGESDLVVLNLRPTGRED